MPGLGGAGRTPRTQARVRRNWGRMSDSSGLTGGEAVQIDINGKIVLVVAPGEPFTQDANGLALTTGEGLEEVTSTLQVDRNDQYSHIIYYG